MLEYGSIAVRNAKSHSHASPNIFRKIIAESKTENADGSLADLDIQSEAANFIVAGTDTTAITLTYLIYNVLKDRDLQKRLEDEVETLRETFDSRDVEGLELLNAVLEEALRLWGAAPGSLLRMVPKNGVHLDGYFVPEDTTVSTQAYTIHRDPEIFPDPERYVFHQMLFSSPRSISLTPYISVSNPSAGSLLPSPPNRAISKRQIMPSAREPAHASVFTLREWKWFCVSLCSSEIARAQGLRRARLKRAWRW